MVMISQRPFPPDRRAEARRWKGDRIVGLGHRSAIGTQVELATRFVMLLHLPVPDSLSLEAALLRQLGGLPPELRRSISWDQGTEMARQVPIREAPQTPVYFCEPGKP